MNVTFIQCQLNAQRKPTARICINPLDESLLIQFLLFKLNTADNLLACLHK